jgi:hypothetical protein
MRVGLFVVGTWGETTKRRAEEQRIDDMVCYRVLLMYGLNFGIRTFLIPWTDTIDRRYPRFVITAKPDGQVVPPYPHNILHPLHGTQSQHPHTIVQHLPGRHVERQPSN